ncbi:MAG: DALR domain-containing protein, partial [Anaerovorax sp.]
KHNLEHLIQNSSGSMTETEKKEVEELNQYREKFMAVMDDDLNTADGISAIFELIKAINTHTKDGASKEFAENCFQLLNELATVLGLLQDKEEDGVAPEIMSLVEERQEARKNKNFARADEIRDILKSKGLAVEDTPQGPRVVKI